MEWGVEMEVEVVIVVEMEGTQRTEDRGRFRHGDDLSGAGTSMVELTFTPNRGREGRDSDKRRGGEGLQKARIFDRCSSSPLVYTHTPP